MEILYVLLSEYILLCCVSECFWCIVKVLSQCPGGAANCGDVEAM